MPFPRPRLSCSRRPCHELPAVSPVSNVSSSDKITGLCLDPKNAVITKGARPIFDPSQALAFSKSGLAKCAPRKLLKEMKRASRNVTDREMRELHVARDKLGQRNDIRVPWHHAVPKERQLIAKLATLRRDKVSREIPPFNLEFRMVSVIGRKLILPSRQGQAPVGPRAATRSEKRRTKRINCRRQRRSRSWYCFAGP